MGRQPESQGHLSETFHHQLQQGFVCLASGANVTKIRMEVEDRMEKAYL